VHIYNHHALYIACLSFPMLLIGAFMVCNKQLAASSGGWFRWAYAVFMGGYACSGLRNVILAILPMSRRLAITDVLEVASFACSVAMIPLVIIGVKHKKRAAKLALLPSTPAQKSDSWPPAPEESP